MSAQISSLLLDGFINFFGGNSEKYGSHKYDKNEEVVEGKKEEGKWSGWVKDEYKNFIKPTVDTYREHLEGKSAMGVCPIRTGNKVKFAVIDYDVYKNQKRAVNYIYENNFPLLCFRSKSGGLHLYMFFEEEIPAKQAKEIMKRFLPLLNLSSKTEIFPKQDRLKGEESGSWINLPYFNIAEPKSYLFGNDLEQMSLAEALNIISSKLQTSTIVDDFFDTLEYSDAPPCLQALALHGVTENRNIYLFNLATYLKSKYGKGTEFAVQLAQANTELTKPLPANEITAMVGSHESKNYAYKCKEEPLCSHCNAKECKTREFGVGGGIGVVSNLDFEELTQYRAEETAYYEWKVNGVMLHFKDEGEIIMQDSFRKQCMRKLHVVPQKLKNDTWTGIINTSLENIIVKDIEEASSLDPFSMFRLFLKEFLIGRPLAINREQILVGKVWYSKKDFAYLFRIKDLYKFLITDRKFTLLPSSDIQRKLLEINYGGKIGKSITIKNKTYRVTKVPKDYITEEDKISIKDEDLEVSFEEFKKDPF